MHEAEARDMISEKDAFSFIVNSPSKMNAPVAHAIMKISLWSIFEGYDT